MQITLISMAGLIGILTLSAPAGATLVYGVQPATGNILTINPTTGAVLNSYATPAPIASNSPYAGVSFAAPLGELLYINQFPSPTLYALNPATGAVISTFLGDFFPNVGLSYGQSSATNFVYYADVIGGDVHRQTNFGGARTLFSTTPPPSIVHGLGGDGYGREFGIYSDGMIHEYNPLVQNAPFLEGFAAPAGALGLAFDGAFLYVSTTAGDLLTLNTNTGVILNSVAVGGGALLELGANAAPEPSTLAILGTALAGFLGLRRKNSALKA